MSLPPSQAASAPPSRAKSLLMRILGGLTTVMALILAGSWVYGLFTIPGCDDTRIRDTLTSILRNNGVPTISGFEPVRETERTSEVAACHRIINVPNGRLDMTYRIVKQGFGNNQVQATWRQL